MALNQQTIRKSVGAQGVALHTGEPVAFELHPAPVDHGIQFVRTDLPGSPAIAVTPEAVNAEALTRRTELHNGKTQVGTTEHLLAACMGMGVANLLVRIDGPEIPIFDGSGWPFTNLLAQAGIEVQDAPRAVWKLKNPVRLVHDNAEMVAIPADRMQLCFFAELFHAGIENQSAELDLASGRFINTIAPARTFVFYKDVERLRAEGLIKGGSLDCAIVLRDGKPMDTNYRLNNELAAHKLLDFLGDLAILGRPINALLTARASGHAMNFEFVKMLKKELF